MAAKDSKIVKSNFFNESSIGGGKRYDVRWDPTEGNVEIIQSGLVPIGGRKILFNNQTWNDSHTSTADDATKDQGDFVPNILATEAGREEYATKLAEVLIEAHQNNNSQGVLPEWVLQYKNTKTNEEKNQIIKDLDSGTLTSKVAEKNNINVDLQNDAPLSWTDFKKTDVTLNTIKELMLDGPLKYPIDAIYSNRRTGYNQDHVRITQYTYKPPRAGLVASSRTQAVKDNVEKDTSAWDIATKGFARTTPLESYLGMVRLPMPTDISDSNNVAWGQDQVNNFAAAMTSAVGGNLGVTAGAATLGAIAGHWLGGGSEAGAGAGVMIGALSNMGIKNLDDLRGQGGATARATIQSRLLAQAGVQVSPEAILARGLGVIPNSNMELLFNAPALREFAFSWKMTPRDEYEAKKVRHIIRFFKQGMAARKMQGKGSSAAGASSLFLGTPNVFHIQYKTNRDEDIEGLNRIKTCAVTGCAINYTPDGVWSAYEEGQPVSTVMSLRMQELEPVYDTDYQGDVLSGRKFREIPGSPGSKAGGDLYKISLDEVGY